MNFKKIVAGTLVAGLLLTNPLYSFASAAETTLTANPLLAELHLDNPVTADETGYISLPEDGSLLNICFPSRLGETEIDTIAPAGFRGCSYFRSVFLPAQIVNIGDNAFADCAGLEYIVLMDRQNTDGMNLGKNWSGSATVVFGLVQQEEAASVTEPTEETTPATEPEAAPAETEGMDETVPAETTPATEPAAKVTPQETEPAETEGLDETVPAETTPATEPAAKVTPRVTKPAAATAPAETTAETVPNETMAAPETVPAEVPEKTSTRTTLKQLNIVLE